MAKPEGFAGLPEHHQPTAGRVERPMRRMSVERFAEISAGPQCGHDSADECDALCDDLSEAISALKAERAEVERLRECVISCGESVLVEGNWRDLPPMVLSSIARYVKENADAESRLSGLVGTGRYFLAEWAECWDNARVSIDCHNAADAFRAAITKATGEQTDD